MSRALKKEQKLYLWDWSQLEDPGPRFENMVASHLLKAVHGWSDLGDGDFELRYLRDKEKREVDPSDSGYPAPGCGSGRTGVSGRLGRAIPGRFALNRDWPLSVSVSGG